MAAPILPASLGKPVTTRTFSWKEMVIRQWGSEFAAPDHRIYNWSNGRSFDSTDLGQTGIYRRPSPRPPPVIPGSDIGLESDSGRMLLESGAGYISLESS